MTQGSLYTSHLSGYLLEHRKAKSGTPSYMNINTVKLGYIKLGFYEYMVYIEVLSRPEHNPIDFHVK